MGKMGVRFRAKQQTYLLKEERKTYTAWHPQIRVDEQWCFLMDDTTRSKLAEAQDEETAVEMALNAIREVDKNNSPNSP
jgi:hypothetical protein